MVRKVLVLVFGISSVGAAQVCWRARPEATCKSWIITEAIAEVPVISTSGTYRVPGGPLIERRDLQPRFVVTGGMMFNTSPDRALGFTASASTSSTRVEARHRRWLGQTTGVDLNAGLARAKINPDTWAYGLSASAGIATTYLGADLRVDLMGDGPQAVSGTFLTLRTGSRAGATAVLGGLAFLGFGLLMMSGAGT